ncbi:E3 ubiquitin-protein ligase TRIM71-like [Mercenaria mercenaria]|uniref:E3 ubiquitin-protein ligase TRIM71-like n=1 Tax=Mercenaria mercenaria TaxID=6596 RepID=UPI00234F3C22|nr:E3 ubiquitin-protein ligase TRIM71-like [Mercenaria mercenaria]
MEVAGKRVTEEEELIVEEFEKECEPCKGENVATTANGICRECEEYMCNTCFRHHLKAKQCRNHVLVDTQCLSLKVAHKSAENVEKCNRHTNEQIKFYCRTHDIVGCGECMIPDHSGCNPENIKGFAKGYEVTEDFKCLKKKLKGLSVSNDDNKIKVHENQKAIKSMYERALKDVRKFRKDVNDYLDKAEIYIINEAKDIENRNASLLTKLEQDCQLLSSKITEIEQILNKELYSDSALFIQTVNCKPLVLAIEQGVSRVQTTNCTKEFVFVPEKQMHLRSSIHNFGRITTKVSAVNASLEAMKLPREEQDKSIHLEEEPVWKTRDKKKSDLKSPQTFAVGARVRLADRNIHKFNMGGPGTVTAVHTNPGQVSVTWDATGLKTVHGISQLKLI